MDGNHNEKHELTTEEFQRKLFEWFEQRGLLSELRAYMRHRMITALNSSGLDGPCQGSRFSVKTPLSPTLQALLLLVAEFLVQQQYHFTVSVMVAEVPLLASLPKFADYVTHISNPSALNFSRNVSFPRYSERDVNEILESVGIVHDSESSRHIHGLYSKNEARESLLACILTALPAVAQSYVSRLQKPSALSESYAKKRADMDDSARWMEEMRLILLHAQVTSAQLQQVEDLLMKLQSGTAARVRKEDEEKHNHMMQIREQQLQAEALVREEEFRAGVERAEEDLRVKSAHLEKVTAQLQQQHDEVLSRLNRVQRHADEIQRQENDVAEREKQLERKQHLLKEEQHTLTALRTDLQKASSALRQGQADTNTLVELSRLQERCSYLESELKETKTQLQTSLSRTDAGVQATQGQEYETTEAPAGKSTHSPKHDTHTSQQLPSSAGSLCSYTISNTPSKGGNEKPKDRGNQVSLLMRVLRRLQQENSELRAHSAQQRRRIDELTSRAAQLAVHIAARSVSPVRTQPRAQTSAAATQPAPPPAPVPPPLPTRHVRHGSPIGAGGDLTQPNVRHSSSTAAHTLRMQGREWRRKPPKRLLQHMSLATSLSSDESPTEEILREARNRLRKLEEESEAVDRRYRDFRARQTDNLSSTASVLFVPSQDPSASVQPTPSSFRPSPAPAPASSHLFRSSAYSPVVSRPGITVSPLTYQSSPLGTSYTSTGHPSRLATNFSPFTQSQFTIPEHSSPAASVKTAARTQNILPYRPSVLRRPTERIRDLLDTRASILKEYGVGANVTQQQQQQQSEQPGTTTAAEEVVELQENNRSSPKLQETNHSVTKTTDEMQKLSLSSPRKEQTAVNAAVLSPSLSNVPNNGFAPSVSNIQNIGAAASSSTIQNNSLNDKNELPIVKEDLHEFALNQILMENTSPRASFSKLKQMSHFPVEGNESPLSQQSDHLLQNSLSPVQPENENLPLNHEDQDGPKPPGTPPLRSAVFEATLNEVSTLSSSAVVSPNLEEPKQNLENLRLSPIATVVANEPTSEVLAGGPVEASQNVVQPPVAEARHLLNASVSSIELSDQRISVGSEDKKTDDDDFW